MRASSRFATAATSLWNFAFGNFIRRHGTVLVRYQVPVLVNDMHRLTTP